MNLYTSQVLAVRALGQTDLNPVSIVGKLSVSIKCFCLFCRCGVTPHAYARSVGLTPPPVFTHLLPPRCCTSRALAPPGG